MFRCERCETRFTNGEAKGLEYCPLCQEDGVEAPLVLKLFLEDGPLTGAVDRTRRVVQKLGGRQAAPRKGRTSRVGPTPPEGPAERRPVDGHLR